MNNFEKIYNIDTSFLQEKVKKFSKEKWNEFDYRQKTFDVHKNTRTIPLIFNKDLNNLNTPNEYDDFVNFSGELLNLYNIFLNHYKKGSILRALLVKLNAKSEISKHIDNGIGLEKSKRHHIPIITNSKVLFTVDDEDIINMFKIKIEYLIVPIICFFAIFYSCQKSNYTDTQTTIVAKIENERVQKTFSKQTLKIYQLIT